MPSTRLSPISLASIRVLSHVDSHALRKSTLLPAIRHVTTSADSKGGSKALRKQVTVTSDDGRIQWQDLTTREKAARTTQQTFNFGVVLAGLLGTGLVAYFLYQELLAVDSKTRIFNRAVDRIQIDPKSLELLGGHPKKIRAFGEPTTSRWARARHIASSTQVDASGTEHFRMHFNVQGAEALGVVTLHLTKRPDSSYEYQLLALDVAGHPRHYLEDGRKTKINGSKSSLTRWLGVK